MAKRALEQGDVVEAEAQWHELAKRGFPEASYQLGKLYLEKQDYPAAQAALDKAWRGNVKPAALVLAKLYESPTYSRHTPEKAAKWYRIAADLGYRGARLKLADFYLSGYGVLQDTERAFAMYEALADENYLPVFYRLGFIYETGEGRVLRPEEAAKWYHKAVLQGHKAARFRLAALYAEGRGVPKDLDRAVQYYQKILEETHQPEKRGYAAFRLGGIYEELGYDGRNLEKSAEWYRVASLTGHPQAQFRLANFYLHGQGVPQNSKKALGLYQELIERGYVPAMYRLGAIYETGERISPQPLKARQWYEKAAEGGHIGARYRLALLYLSGKISPHEKNKGFMLLKDLADQDYVPAYYRLGRYFETRPHLPDHLSRAEFWYKKAAVSGHHESNRRLALFVIRGQLSTMPVETALDLLSGEANEGNGSLAFEIGSYYERNSEEKGSVSLATHWYKKSLALGHPAASYRLGNLHAQNNDFKQAKFYFSLAAEQGSLPAAYNLAELYLSQGQEKDAYFSAAIKWYRTAAKGGHVPAQMAMWELLSDSEVLDEQKEASGWLKRAADAGDPEALMTYGIAYIEALIVPKDEVKGLSYLLAAARKLRRGAVKRALVVMSGMEADQVKKADAASKKLAFP